MTKKKTNSDLTAIKKSNLAPGIQCLLEGRVTGITVSEKSHAR